MSAADFDPLFQAAGAQYGVDPMMLKALATQESSLNPAAVNPASGAAGLMGFTPATAKAYGINPLDPQQAIPAAAQMFAENLKRFGGNVEQAVAAHFAGPDQKLWGPKTDRYVSDVANKFAAIRQSGGYAPAPQAQEGVPSSPSAQPDDIDAMLAARAQGKSVAAAAPASPAASPASDPIDAMLAQRAAGQQIAGASQAQPSSAVAKPEAQGSATAADLAAGGASPNTVADLGQIASGAAHGVGSMFNNAANFVERHLPFFPADVAARDTATQAQVDQQFSQTASPGEKASAFVAPMLMPLGDLAAPGNAVRAGITKLAGTAAPGIGRVVGSLAGNATNGAIMATGAPIDPNQPVGQQDARNLVTGAALGAALPAVASAGKAIGSNLWNAVKPIVNPDAYVGQGFAGALGDQAAGVAQNIRSAPQFVPGSAPTTAQAGANPVLVATEKAAANANPDLRNALAQRAIDNNDARWQALMGVAKSPEALQAAQAAREDATFPLYAAAGDQTANVGASFMKLAQRPAMRQAMQQADQLAANRGETLVWPQPGPNGTLARSPSREINGRALDYTNRALGDMIANAKATGNKELASGLADAQSQLQSWMQRYIPAQRQAAQTYAQMSVPINTMEAGQAIANGLGTRAMNPGGAPEIGLMPYRSALSSAMKNAKYGIDANALGTLQGIGQDLQRATISNSLRSPGSDTAYNLAAQGWLARQLYGPTFGGAGNLGKAVGAIGATALGHPMVGLGILGGGNKIGQMVGGRLNDRLSNFLLDPNALLPYLDARAAAPVNGTQQALAAALRRQVVPAVVSGVSRRSLVNAP